MPVTEIAPSAHVRGNGAFIKGFLHQLLGFTLSGLFVLPLSASGEFPDPIKR
jgi:hypothetical protein